MATRIQPIWPDSNQYVHTLRHLYALQERWDLIIAGLPDCEALARTAGCTDSSLKPRDRNSFNRACASCRTRVLADHNTLYAPAYFAAIEAPCETLPVEDRCTGILGKNGVLTIVTPARAVRTAYRVVPIGPGGTVTQDDFLHAGRWHLHDLAMLAAKAKDAKMTAAQSWTEMIEADLTPLLAGHRQGTLSAAQTYRLLVLLGRCAQLGTAPLQLAQRLGLDDLQQGLAALLARVTLPDPAKLLDALQANLEDDSEPQAGLFGSLINLDNLLTVWELSGKRKPAEKLARSAVSRLLGHPDRAQALAQWAQRRLVATPRTSPVRQLWQAVAQEIAATAPQAGIWELLVSVLAWQPVKSGLQLSLAAPRGTVEPLERSWFDCYQEGEELIVQVRLPTGQRLRGTPHLALVSAEDVRNLPVQVKHTQPGGVWLSLGTEDQLAKSLAQASAALGVTMDQLESVHIQLALEPEADEEHKG